jgi:3',5'-cyclic-AMP phosphodiesterase
LRISFGVKLQTVTNMKKLLLVYIPLLLSIWACESFEYSPNQIFDSDAPQQLNEINLQKLLSNTDTDDTVTIAFVGDSQRFYDEVDDFVERVNEFSGVDFVLLAGDITDFGLLNEYKWIHDSFSKLNAPFLGVIGNHDVIANGEDVFARMFGPLNYTFVYDSIKFVVHNTNSREYISETVPDIQWLQQELHGEIDPGVKNFIAVSHVPPTDDDFNQNLVEPYSKLFASTPGFLVSLHGHIHEHTDQYPFNDGVRYITSFAFNQRSFVILKIVNGQVLKQIIDY